jgi:hypothetical protein
MTTKIYEDYILNKLLPDIAKKCPWGKWKMAIFSSNKTMPLPHKINPFIFQDKCIELDIYAEMYYQPANSPDLNICDSSFFTRYKLIFIKSRFFEYPRYY